MSSYPLLNSGLAGRVSSWLMLRCFKIGFFGGACRLDVDSMLSVLRTGCIPGEACSGVGVQFGPRCRGPYSHVTSESLSLKVTTYEYTSYGHTEMVRRAGKMSSSGKSEVACRCCAPCMQTTLRALKKIAQMKQRSWCGLHTNLASLD